MTSTPCAHVWVEPDTHGHMACDTEEVLAVTATIVALIAAAAAILGFGFGFETFLVPQPKRKHMPFTLRPDRWDKLIKRFEASNDLQRAAFKSDMAVRTSTNPFPPGTVLTVAPHKP